MSKESRQIQRYLSGQMPAGEKLAFDKELGLDPFLSEALEGYRSDPQALYDLPVYNTSMHLWWAATGLGAVLLVFLSISQWTNTEAIPEMNSKASTTILIMPLEEPTQTKLNPENVFIEPQEIKRSEKVYESTMFESIEAFPVVDVLPIREIESAKNHVVSPKINRYSSGSYLLGLKIAKSNYKPMNEWRFEYGNREKHTPAQFENQESFHFNRVIIPRFTKVENQTYEDVLSEALEAYRENDFNTCLVKLDKIKEEHPGDVNVLFYSGLCSYHLGKYRNAILSFSKTSEAANAIFAPEAKWYLALSFRKSGETEEAEKLFMEISTEGGFYSKRAAEMGKE